MEESRTSESSLAATRDGEMHPKEGKDDQTVMSWASRVVYNNPTDSSQPSVGNSLSSSASSPASSSSPTHQAALQYLHSTLVAREALRLINPTLKTTQQTLTCLTQSLLPPKQSRCVPPPQLLWHAWPPLSRPTVWSPRSPVPTALRCPA